jgi:hypothetical protein
MRNTAAAPALLALILLVSAIGCSDESGDDTDPTTASASAMPSTPTMRGTTATPSTIPEASASPFTAATRADDGGHGSGNGLGLTGVRTAQHPGYDRVVFDLGGTGTPGWRVEYTTDPRTEGSGDPVTLKGTVFLQVILRGVGLPFDTGLAPFGDSTTRVPGSGTKTMAEIAPGGVFEGEQQAFIGLTGTKRPFRVFSLANPTRVVVDVRND